MAIERPEQMLGNFIADALAHAASPRGWKGLSLVTSELSSWLAISRNSITSARPPWQRIRHGTKQGSKHQSAGCGRARSGVFCLLSPEWPELPTAHTPNLVASPLVVYEPVEVFSAAA